MNNIVITGFMASGKTEVSKAIERLSDYARVDTDDMIVEYAQKSINDIFAEDGEDEFRRIERMIIKKAADLNNTVISTGGGVVLNKENMDILRSGGIIVNLSPDFEVIESRLEKARDSRPLLQNQSIDEIRERFLYRKPYYDNCDFSVKVDSEKTPIDLAKEILALLD